ncbi:PREDICTED: uncharacterized protein LOC104598115 [Nelumbo nucifera]|uniref:Uncharacterized protein LOC104598115 n=2 Tax=Nelumbo nucifera TaxID=4432 RepID=A0A1U8A8N9_NELNU|nr:PREDICTED: uncharacterized protein LOC104598115 [Nelumbo nucifera]DAD31274.1 TPA_asm: hypothetical protein HUJ06_010125 [Nelumbo nucifera]
MEENELLYFWCVIERFIIPDGLSYFVHPLILFLCHIFLSVKVLGNWILDQLPHPSKDIWVMLLRFSGIVRSRVRVIRLWFSAASRPSDNKVEQVVKEEVSTSEALEISYSVQSFALYGYLIVQPVAHVLKTIDFIDEEGDDEEDVDEYVSADEDIEEYESVVEDLEDLDDDVSLVDDDDDMEEPYFSVVEEPADGSVVGSTDDPDVRVVEDMEDPDASVVEDMEVSDAVSVVEDEHMHDYTFSSLYSSEASVVQAEDDQDQREDVETDPFYSKYSERMRWFDLLSYERSCGMNAILNTELGAPTSTERSELMQFSAPFMSWSKVSKRKLLRIIENDFETVYVSQLCLSWEALHHQYRKVESLAPFPGSQEGVFYYDVAGEFQNFKVLLQRFMENENPKDKRFLSYVRTRFSDNRFLQVPEVTGYLEEVNEGMEEVTVGANEVLSAIRKSIAVFGQFVGRDNRKHWWRKYRRMLWIHPPVEDPKDLKLLVELEKLRRKKKLFLEDLKKKKNCWLKRRMAIEDSQKVDMILSGIDLKLVERVLKLSMISTAQLKWCQDKLHNIEFKNGRIARACTNSCLFPAS